VSAPFPEPMQPMSSREALISYLDHFRARVIEKVDALEVDQRGVSHLPSGWTPLELVRHLTYVERRWLVWGFLGEDVGDPWGDQRDGRWSVGDLDPATVVRELIEQGVTTGRVVRGHDLDEVGAPSERWEGQPPATLERVLLHLLQEYARHLGQLDVVVELVAGELGE